MPHRICYAVKANSNLAVLRILRDLGAGADIVSGGELARALAAGFAPDRIVFSGVGKADDELRQAVRSPGSGHINVESLEELHRLAAIAEAERVDVAVGIRVNPDVTADTHPYISTGKSGIKFGVPVDQVLAAAAVIAGHPRLELTTIAMHLGSQLSDTEPFRQGIARLLELAGRCGSAGAIRSGSIDIGGGLGDPLRGRAADGPGAASPRPSCRCSRPPATRSTSSRAGSWSGARACCSPRCSTGSTRAARSSWWWTPA